MKIWLRWLKIVFTCGLGRHAKTVYTPLENGIVYSECTRCHNAFYGARNSLKVVHLHPNYWDVARGLYDKGIQR